MWLKQDQHPGDRLRLFREVGWHVHADRVLYPGSYVDVAASFTFPSVTYVDSDDRAAAFFADRDGVQELVGAQPGAPEDATVTFIHSDYRAALPVAAESCDLLVSLYAGFVSEFCTQYLRVGGTLLVNPSHGDAAMASIDPRYRLAGVVRSRSGQYSVTTAELERYLIPKKSITPSRDSLHTSGRGVAYTRPAFAYLFQRVQ